MIIERRTMEIALSILSKKAWISRLEIRQKDLEQQIHPHAEPAPHTPWV
jgi:hypothetical protein